MWRGDYSRMWHLYFKGWWQFCRFPFCQGEGIVDDEGKDEAGHHVLRIACLLLIIAVMNVCTAVSRHISLYCVPHFIECFFSFSFAYLAINVHAVTHVHTHTHIPGKASHNLDSQHLLQWVCVCVRPCVGAQGGLHMHVGVHTCVCALCYQFKVFMSPKSIPSERHFS
jgi:hypothetical protein